MHREADRSAGLHLFQELSTLGQHIAHTPLFCEAAAEYCSCLQRDRASLSAVPGPVPTRHFHLTISRMKSATQGVYDGRKDVQSAPESRVLEREAVYGPPKKKKRRPFRYLPWRFPQ
jgi:hypothetical protein